MKIDRSFIGDVAVSRTDHRMQLLRYAVLHAGKGDLTDSLLARRAGRPRLGAPRTIARSGRLS